MNISRTSAGVVDRELVDIHHHRHHQHYQHHQHHHRHHHHHHHHCPKNIKVGTSSRAKLPMLVH
eukprot:4382403-Karenia_brevis.AAC.1